MSTTNTTIIKQPERRAADTGEGPPAESPPEQRSLYHLIEASVKAHGPRPCYWVKADGKNYAAVSYADWRADMRRFSAFLLHRLELAHRERVGLICDNRYEWNLISMGITTLGAVDVPRGCDATPHDLAYILGHTECRLLVVENETALQSVLACLESLPALERIICIEGPERHKELAASREALGNRRLHFFLDALQEGEALTRRFGETPLRRRGERIQPDDLATIIYTSGTTGRPKGVMLEHRSFCWAAERIMRNYPISERDRVVIFLPPWHIAERLLETTIIARGGGMAPSHISTLAADLAAIKPTFLISVPRVWEQLYKRIFDNVRKQGRLTRGLFHFAHGVLLTYTDLVDRLLDRFAYLERERRSVRFQRRITAALRLPLYAALSLPARLILKKVKRILGGRIRFALSGAGALPETVAFFFRCLGIPILDGYGLTETTAVTAFSRLPWPKRGCVGRPLPGVQVQLRDPAGRTVRSPGIRGELWQKGPHVMRGYYREPEKTAAVLEDGWLNSGDLFAWTTTGELKFTGRSKDTIVLAGGENVEPEPIEMKLKESPWIAQAVVVGQDQKSLGVLIVPAFDRCRAEAAERGVQAPADPRLWQEDQAMRELFRARIKERISAENGFKTFERVTGFALLAHEFEKGRTMTETMKIKRQAVVDTYSREIAGIFGG